MSEDEIRAMLQGLSGQITELGRRLDKEDSELWEHVNQLKVQFAVANTMLAEIKALLSERCSARGKAIDQQGAEIGRQGIEIHGVHRRIDEIEQCQAALTRQHEHDRAAILEMQRTVNGMRAQLMAWSGGGAVMGGLLALGAPQLLKLVFG